MEYGLLIRKFPEKYLPAYMRLAPYLACYDMRSEIAAIAKAYGASERAVRDYIKTIRDANVKALHIRVPSAFNFSLMVVKAEKRVRELRHVVEIRRKSGYLINYKEYMDTDGRGKSLMVFVAPDDLKSEICEVVSSMLSSIQVEHETTFCTHYPISPCSFLSKYGLSGGGEEVRRRWSDTGFAEAKRIASQRIAVGDLYELGLVFLAVLDANPLAMRGEVTNHTLLARFVSDYAPWALGLLGRYKRRLGEVYDELSRRRVLGRTLLWGFQEAAPLLVSTSADKAVELHYIASSTVATGGVMVCDDGRVYAIVPALLRLTRFLEEAVKLGVNVYFVTRGVRFQIPLRLWDSRSKRWTMPGG